MYRKYIAAVRPHEGYILEIEYVSGSRLFLDMKPHLHKLRFHPLTDAAIWNSAATEGDLRALRCFVCRRSRAES